MDMLFFLFSIACLVVLVIGLATIVDIERNKIPAEAKEGDVLLVEDDKISIGETETEKKKKRIEEMTMLPFF